MSDPEWASWPDEKLMELRLCDLGVSAVDSGFKYARQKRETRGLRPETCDLSIVQRASYSASTSIQHMRVNHSRTHILVAQQLLHRLPREIISKSVLDVSFSPSTL